MSDFNLIRKKIENVIFSGKLLVVVVWGKSSW